MLQRLPILEYHASTDAALSFEVQLESLLREGTVMVQQRQPKL